MLALDSGIWAEWVAAIGTVLAFGATSVAIWAGHRLRLAEHRRKMYLETLKVRCEVTLTQESGEDTDAYELGEDGTPRRMERAPYSHFTYAKATIENGCQWPITDVRMILTTRMSSEKKDKDLFSDHEVVRFIHPGDFDVGETGPVKIEMEYFKRTYTEDFVSVTFSDIEGTQWLWEGNLLYKRHRFGLVSRLGARLYPRMPSDLAYRLITYWPFTVLNERSNNEVHRGFKHWRLVRI
jgi:hypothetical protein